MRRLVVTPVQYTHLIAVAAGNVTSDSAVVAVVSDIVHVFWQMRCLTRRRKYSSRRLMLPGELCRRPCNWYSLCNQPLSLAIPSWVGAINTDKGWVKQRSGNIHWLQEWWWPGLFVCFPVYFLENQLVAGTVSFPLIIICSVHHIFAASDIFWYTAHC